MNGDYHRISVGETQQPELLFAVVDLNFPNVVRDLLKNFSRDHRARVFFKIPDADRDRLGAVLVDRTNGVQPVANRFRSVILFKELYLAKFLTRLA